MTKEQERARAKRRYERQQVKAAQKAAETRRNKQAAIVAAVVVAMVLGFIVIAKAVSSGDTKSATPATGTATSSAGVAVAAGCTQPPAAPGTVGRLTAPSKADIAALAGKTVTATMTTNCGDIAITLEAAKAPIATASFLQLAQTGYWKDAPCHRLTTQGIFVLQCGDPTGTGSGSPGYGFAIENDPKDNVYKRGYLAMARPGNKADGNGGQFFIVYKDSTIGADDAGGYTVFGEVTSGMDIVDKIAAGGATGTTGDGAPKLAISTLSVTTLAKKD